MSALDRRGPKRKAESWLERGARLGFAVKGIVYATIGLLAARLALGQSGGRTTDPQGALRAIGASTFGELTLTVIGVGLLSYSGWRLLAAMRGSDEDGHGFRARLTRLGKTLDGVFHGWLGLEALQLLSRARRSQSTEDMAQHWSAKALPIPAGRWVLLAVSIGMAAYAIYQIVRQIRSGARDHLQFGDTSEGAQRTIDLLGRYGTSAMSVVLIIIAWMLLRATLTYDPSKAGGIGLSLAKVLQERHGRFLLGIVSLGFVSFGAFQIASARYRRIRVTNYDKRSKVTGRSEVGTTSTADSSLRSE